MLQSFGLQRVRHDLVTEHIHVCFIDFSQLYWQRQHAITVMSEKAQVVRDAGCFLCVVALATTPNTHALHKSAPTSHPVQGNSCYWKKHFQFWGLLLLMKTEHGARLQSTEVPEAERKEYGRAWPQFSATSWRPGWHRPRQRRSEATANIPERFSEHLDIRYTVTGLRASNEALRGGGMGNDP